MGVREKLLNIWRRRCAQTRQTRQTRRIAPLAKDLVDSLMQATRKPGQDWDEDSRAKLYTVRWSERCQRYRIIVTEVVFVI